jgi:hypothetical protein
MTRCERNPQLPFEKGRGGRRRLSRVEFAKQPQRRFTDDRVPDQPRRRLSRRIVFGYTRRDVKRILSQSIAVRGGASLRPVAKRVHRVQCLRRQRWKPARELMYQRSRMVVPFFLPEVASNKPWVAFHPNAMRNWRAYDVSVKTLKPSRKFLPASIFAARSLGRRREVLREVEDPTNLFSEEISNTRSSCHRGCDLCGPPLSQALRNRVVFTNRIASSGTTKPSTVVVISRSPSWL